MSAWSLLKSGVLLDLYFFKNNRAAFLSMLLWPYLILGLILGMGHVVGSPQAFRRNVGAEVDPLTFFVSSTLVAMAAVDVMWGVGGSVLEHRWVGTLPYVLISPNRTSLTLVLSYVPRYLLSTAIQLAEFSPLLVLSSGPWEAAGDLAVMALAMTAGMLPLLGFSAVFAALLISIEEESNVLGWLNPLILLFSGAFYPAHMLPRWARLVSEVLPTTYTVELARLSAALGSPGASEVVTLMGILLGMSALYNAASLAAVGAGERRAMRRGAI